MNYQPQNYPPTIDGLRASIEASNRYLTEKHAETERVIKENAVLQKETDRLMKETDRLMKETWQQIKENAASQKETDRQMKETDKKIDRTNQQIGGISKSNGEFCEEYFVNAFKESPTFLGQTFDHVLDNLKPHPGLTAMNDQYDLVLHNGTTTVLIEMKYKADIADVKRMFKKLHSYRANYPMFKDYKIYLGLASFSFSAPVKARAEKEGIVLIQQQGEKIEVITKNIKVW